METLVPMDYVSIAIFDIPGNVPNMISSEVLILGG